MITLTVQQWLSITEESRKTAIPPFPAEGDIEIGVVRYSADDDNFLIFRLLNSPPYKISAERILSGAGLLDFLWQVHHKDWCRAHHLKDLLDCITCYVYREHNGQFPQMFFDVAGGMNRGLDSP